MQVARELNALQTGFATLEPRKVLGNLRQEVTVLAQLSHPNIVALLGVSIRPLCIVLEFAPMGNVSRIIEKRVEEWGAKQVDSASTVLRMPGGVLGHVMTTKIAMQVCEEEGRLKCGGEGVHDHDYLSQPGGHSTSVCT